MKTSREKVLQRISSLLGTEVKTPAEGNAEPACLIHQDAGVVSDPLAGSSSMGGGLLSTGHAFDAINVTDLPTFFVPGSDSKCTLPSLDIFSGGPLDLGVLASGSWAAAKPTSEMDLPPFGVGLPTMAASVFGALAPPAPSPAGGERLASESCTKETRERAATSLAKTISWSVESCIKAPATLARSLSIALSSVVDSRMKSCTLVLLRHSLEIGDNRSRSRLLALLSTGNTISVNSVSTSFSALTLPKEFESKAAADEGKVIMPVIFEANFEVAIRGKPMKIALRNPGTIQGTFANEKNALNTVEVSLDTDALIDEIIEQARLVVVQAVATATTLPGAGGLNIPAQLQAQVVGNSMEVDIIGTRQTMHSASHGDTGRTEMKSPPSALQSFASMKLVSKLKSGKDRSTATSALTLGKKNRSVTFKPSNMESPKSSGSDNSHNSKRQKKDALGVTNLRSSRSFGKPNAELFENSRNATFADFGRAAQSHHIPSFSNVLEHHTNNNTSNVRNGSLGRNATFSHLSSGTSLATHGGKNSAFELQRPGSGLNSGSRATNGGSASNLPGSGIQPRHNSLLDSFASSSGKKFGSSAANLNDFLH